MLLTHQTMPRSLANNESILCVCIQEETDRWTGMTKTVLFDSSELYRKNTHLFFVYEMAAYIQISQTSNLVLLLCYQFQHKGQVL